MSELIHYRDFGNLRFLNFFPRNAIYDDGDIGGTTTSIGAACLEGYGFTSFAKMRGGEETGAISLDFSQDCPEIEGNAVLERAGLSLRKGALAEEVLASYGQPQEDQTNPQGFRFCRFVVGDKWKYYLSCSFQPDGRLYRLTIARKDLVDAAEAS